MSVNVVSSAGNLTPIATRGQFVQYPIMPTPSVDIVNKIAQYTGATDSNYINGYFYKCILDGSNYIWSNISVQTGGGSDNVIGGYFNSSDNLFYEESTYTTAITGEDNTIYVSLDTNLLYRYNGSIFIRVDDVTSSLNNKADKVSSATNGDLAGLDSNGNLTDSGILATNVITKSVTSGLVKNDGTIDTNTYATTTQLANKADKVASATTDDFATLDSNGNLTDSGINKNIVPSNASSSNKLATVSDVSAAYRPSGNATLATLPPLTEANLNRVYNMTADFTTTSDFAEGAGIAVKAGNEVGIIDVSSTSTPDIKYTVLGGFVDLSNYIEKSNTVGLIKNDGTVDQTSYATAASVSNILNGTDIDSFGDVETALADKTDLTVIAPAFSTSNDYLKDALVIYQGKLYKFKQDKNMGAWDSTKVVETTVRKRIGDIDDRYDEDFDVQYVGSMGVHGDDELNWREISLNKSTTPTNADTKPITSGGVYDALQQRIDWSSYAKTGVHQLLPMPIDVVKANNTTGTWNDNVYTVNSVTFTCTVENGYITKITTNGTASATITFFLMPDTITDNYDGLRINGCPSNGSPSTYYLSARIGKQSDGSFVTEGADSGNGATIPSINLATQKIRVWIVVMSGIDVSGLEWKPLIHVPSDINDTVTPYAMTNQQLMQNKVSWNNVQKSVKKNLLKNTAISRTINGITFTVNADKSITANGTATAETTLFLEGSNWGYANSNKMHDLKPNTSYTLTDGNEGNLAQTNAYIQYVFNDSAGGANPYYLSTNGTGKQTKTTPANIADYTILAWIRINNGITVSNKVFKPMLRLASITNDEYVPYVPDNSELISWEDNSILGTHNLLPFPYTTLPIQYTAEGITYTPNEDGTITVNGTATANAGANLFYNIPVNEFFEKNKVYKLHCDIQKTSGTNRVYFSILNRTKNIRFNTYDGNPDVLFSFDSDTDRIDIYIWVEKDVTLDNFVFKPIITIANDTSIDYTEFSKTNIALTKDVGTKLSSTANSVIGAHNLLPMSITEIKNINTNGIWDGNSYTWRGITYTINLDSDENIIGIEANGTASERGWLFLHYGRLSNVSTGELDSEGAIGKSFSNTDGEIIISSGLVNSNTTQNMNNMAVHYATGSFRTYIIIQNGYVLDHVMFYPMVRAVGDTDTTFAPYVKTNKELTKDIIENTNELNSDEPYVSRRGLGNIVDLDLVGCSVVWNQLVDNGNFADTSVWVTARADLTTANNEATLTATDDNGVTQQGVNIKDGHKYFISADIKANKIENNMALVVFNGSWDNMFQVFVDVASSYKKYSGIINGVSGNVQLFRLVSANTTITNKYKNIMFIDLTQMFGSTIADEIYAIEQETAGAGVALFKKYFPLNYYNYNTGSLQNVNISSRKVVGKNLFTTNEKIRTAFTTIVDDGKSINIKNTTASGWVYNGFKIDVEPNTLYKLLVDVKYTSGVGAISVRNKKGDTGFVVLSEKLNITSDQKVKLVFNSSGNSSIWILCFSTLATAEVGDVTYNNMTLEYATDFAGFDENSPYEFYEEYVYDFDSSKQLCGVPKLINNKLVYDGDIYKSEGKIIRKYGTIDLGSLTWTKNSTVTDHYRFVAQPSNLGGCAHTNNEKPNAICSKFDIINPNQSYAADINGITTDSSGTYIFVYSDWHESLTAEQFKTYMNGVYLVYELATPIEEVALPFQNPQRAFSDGLEEFIDAGVSAGIRDVAIPVGNNSTYSANKILPLIEDYVDDSIKDKINWADNEILGAHNLVPIIVTKPYTQGGVTLTVNDDKTITLDTAGNASTQDVAFHLTPVSKWLANGRYKLSGCKGGGASKYKLDIVYAGGGAAVTNYDEDEVPFTIDNSDAYVLRVVVYSGQTLNNLKISPMVRFASDIVTDYTTPSLSNQMLSEKLLRYKNKLITPATEVSFLLQNVSKVGNTVDVLIHMAQSDIPSTASGSVTIGIVPYMVSNDYAFLDIISDAPPYISFGNAFIRQQSKELVLPGGLNATTGIWIKGTYICQD